MEGVLDATSCRSVFFLDFSERSEACHFRACGGWQALNQLCPGFRAERARADSQLADSQGFQGGGFIVERDCDFMDHCFLV